MSSSASPRVDLHAVLEDLAFLGMTGDALAQRINVRTLVLQRIATGKLAPPRNVREKLCCLWSHLTGKPLEFLPRTTDAENAPRPEVPHLESNDTPGPSATHLEAVMLLWAQITKQG